MNSDRVEARIENKLAEWLNAAVIDTATADRIRAYETTHEGSKRLSWPVLLAVALGTVMLGAGILLFVAAHWDALSPTQRFLLVLTKVALLHAVAAVLTERWPAAAMGLHALGTIATGAAIYLTGQIFNLQEHWPGGLMLWSLAALLGWIILRDWAQPALLALLLPAWLAGEWSVATEHYRNGEHVMAESLLVLAFVYLSADVGGERTPLRRALKWIGGLALFPLCFMVMETGHSGWPEKDIPFALQVVGWTLGLAIPLLLALKLRGTRAWMNVVALVWVVILGTLPRPWGYYEGDTLAQFAWRALGPFLWQSIGALGLVWWGLKEERRGRVNLGVAGFALAVLGFYFTDVMDKLGRSESLIAFGILFLVGGWFLEKTRRRLVARIAGGAA